MMPSSRLIAIALIASGAAVLLSLAAAAEPLDKESCSELKDQQKTLLTNEMKAALARGPDWVKDHLSSEELDKVRRFLSVEEKVAFRCRSNGLVIPKPEPVPLPDRKPPLPPTETADTEPSSEKPASSGLLPERNPARLSSDTADAGPSQTVAESDKTAPSHAPEEGSSQTVADSDKTAPSKTKATR
jgi:hypothetical protein